MGCVSSVPLPAASMAGASAKEVEEGDGCIRVTTHTFTPMVWVLVVFGTLGMAIFGYDTGVVSGAMVLVAEDLSLSTRQGE